MGQNRVPSSEIGLPPESLAVLQNEEHLSLALVVGKAVFCGPIVQRLVDYWLLAQSLQKPTG